MIWQKQLKLQGYNRPTACLLAYGSIFHLFLAFLIFTFFPRVSPRFLLALDTNIEDVPARRRTRVEMFKEKTDPPFTDFSLQFLSQKSMWANIQRCPSSQKLLKSEQLRKQVPMLLTLLFPSYKMANTYQLA